MQSFGRTAILAAVATFLTGSLAAAPAPATTAKPQPKAVAVDPVFDGGEVAKGADVRHDFGIKNDGSAPLEITDVRPACGCTVASYDKTIAPGAVGKVHATVDTLNFQGPIAKALTVFTNDPDNPQLTLTVKVKVTPFVNVSPGYARFAATRGETGGQMKAVETLYAPDGGLTAITGIDSPYPFITATFREAQEGEKLPNIAARQFRVEVTLASDAQVGPLSANLTVHTNHPKAPLVAIPITGFVRPTIAVTPPVGDFGTLHLTEPYSRTINVKSFATEPIHVTSVETDSKGITASFKPVRDGKEYELLVTLPKTMDKGPLHGKLVIHTDSQKQPLIDVELKGNIT
jgi:hypothetical protein